jgi:N-glycosylase/DNA lyase
MEKIINVSDFDLAVTLECGQAFRWRREADGWFVGVVGKEVWRLRQEGDVLKWSCSRETFSPPSQRSDNRECDSRPQYYLSLDRSLPQIIATFPDDEILCEAVQQHNGLRVLRQEPWECLCSFIASSTKQIVQVCQIVELLARCFGEPVEEGFHAFPTVTAIARASNEQLRDCKLGFRAKNLLAAARMIDSGAVKLDALRAMKYERALEELVRLPGVGDKIAGCVLLFSCGFDQAFPIDVWIERALHRIYFPRKRTVTHRQLREFTRTHFGPCAGWAQQYLFFQERMRGRQTLLDRRTQR